MGPVFGILYILSLIGAVAVGRARAGVPQWGRLSFETVMGSLPWAASQILTMWVWPVVLIVWLVRGQPPSPWRAQESRSGHLVVRRVPVEAR